MCSSFQPGDIMTTNEGLQYVPFWNLLQSFICDRIKITYIIYPSKRLHSSGRVVPPLAVRCSPIDEFFCGVLDTFCCAVLLGNSVAYRVCGFRVCSRVWDRFYLSPSPLLISRWGGCSIEQQEETGQALFFPLALRGYALKIKAL